MVNVAFPVCGSGDGTRWVRASASDILLIINLKNKVGCAYSDDRATLLSYETNRFAQMHRSLGGKVGFIAYDDTTLEDPCLYGRTDTLLPRDLSIHRNVAFSKRFDLMFHSVSDVIDESNKFRYILFAGVASSVPIDRTILVESLIDIRHSYNLNNVTHDDAIKMFIAEHGKATNHYFFIDQPFGNEFSSRHLNGNRGAYLFI